MSETESQSEFHGAPRQGTPRLRVIGCGNPYAGDDSVGLEIVRRLRAGAACGCELLAVPQAGADLLEALRGADVVLFVDAVVSGAPPGTLHLVPLPWPGLRLRALGALSSHGWGLGEALGLLAALEGSVPRVVLLGVELATVEAGAPRSPEVEQAICTVVERFPVLCARVTGHDGAFPARHVVSGEDSFPGGS